MTFFQRFVRFGLFLYFRVFHRFRIIGLENVPEAGAFLLASNHVSFFDPPALGCRLPRNLHYFARSSLFRGLFGKLLSALNSIPVDPDGTDASSITKALKVLNAGSPLLVFPEGTRSPNGSLQAPKRGVGVLALKAKVPVLPARVFGGFEILGRDRRWPSLGKRLTIAYGPLLPIEDLDPGPRTKGRSRQVVETIMSAIEGIEVRT